MAATLTTSNAPAVPAAASRADGCDRCGLDMLLRPLREADVQIDTPAGPLLLCRTHQAAAGASLAAWPVSALEG